MSKTHDPRDSARCIGGVAAKPDGGPAIQGEGREA